MNEPLLEKKPSKGGSFGTRHVLALMACLGLAVVYGLRVNLSVALVAMVNRNETNSNNSGTYECPNPGTTNSSVKIGEFNWDQYRQGVILGSFFYGYTVTQLPGGRLAEMFGGKWLLGVGVLLPSVLTLFTPLAARYNLASLIALRVLEGLGEGVTFPALTAMWGKWAPQFERSWLLSLSYSGASLGTILSMPLSAFLADSDFLGGWPSIFYIFGGIGCLWFVFWVYFAYDTPAQHPRISRWEREYIENSTGVREKLPSPWRSILTSPPVWAIICAQVTFGWGAYTMLTCLPTYLRDVLKIDLKTNGLLSTLPYIAMLFTSLLAGASADFLRSRQYMETGKVRKMMQCIATLVPAIALICVQFAGCDVTIVVTLIVISIAGSGICTGGFSANILDISGNFSGTILGISNTLATIPGFVAPYVVGILTNGPGKQTREQWQIVFYIAAGINIFGGVAYLIFAQGVEQPWNQPVRTMTITAPARDRMEYRPIQSEEPNPTLNR